MIKPGEIQTIAARLGLRDTQIEKDYIIGWILRGISQNQTLLNKLAFKGGTALRKVYYPDYRLSEDLDFTAINQISSEELKNNFNQLLEYVFDLIIKMEYKRYDPYTFVNKVKGKKEKLKNGWNKNLSDQIQEIPEFEDSWRQVSAHLRKLDRFMKESK